jgi:predicted adenylyl cyclase CyaB
MKEIEVKILEVNRIVVEKDLTILGARKVFDGNIQTLFFDFKEGTIIEQKNVLRLRKEQEKSELTYKKVHVTPTAKIAEELSVEVSNLETMKRILENLGLSIIDKTQKYRISYTLDDARFDFDRYLDDYEYIPEFLEIEARSNELIYKYAKLLGFKANDCLPWSTTDLIKHYSSRKLTSKKGRQ